VDLAWTHILDPRYGLSKSPKESLGQAAQLAQKAISLDESSPFAQSVLGSVFLAKRQYDNAIAQAEKAVAVGPGDSLAIAQLGRNLAYAGRYEESLARFEQAIRLDPIALNWYSMFVGHCYLFLERYEEAIEILKKVLDKNPKNIMARIRLAAAYSLSGREKEARAEAEKILNQNPKWNISSIAKWPIKNKADSELFKDALRKAGLPG
jgi:adenylate cyclase